MQNIVQCCKLSFCLISVRFIKGFMTRSQPACNDNSEYLAYVRQNYLTRLKENLPKTVLEMDSWLTPPPILKEVIIAFSKLLYFLKKILAMVTVYVSKVLEITCDSVL